MRYEVLIEGRDRNLVLQPWIRRTYVTAGSSEEAIQLAIAHNLTLTVHERPELAGTLTLVDFR